MRFSYPHLNLFGLNQPPFGLSLSKPSFNPLFKPVRAELVEAPHHYASINPHLNATKVSSDWFPARSFCFT
jgi:hypothetical protein